MQTYVLENFEKDDKISSRGFKAKQEKIHSEGERGMDYKKKIIEMVEKINSQVFLKRIYQLVEYLYIHK